jgi:hypothetical protein
VAHNRRRAFRSFFARGLAARVARPNGVVICSFLYSVAGSVVAHVLRQQVVVFCKVKLSLTSLTSPTSPTSSSFLVVCARVFVFDESALF